MNSSSGLVMHDMVNQVCLSSGNPKFVEVIKLPEKAYRLAFDICDKQSLKFGV